MIKLLSFSILLILISAQVVSFQTVVKNSVPNINLSIAAENNIWKKDETSIVRISIENLSEDAVKLPENINFLLTEVAFDGRIGKNNFSAPINLNKPYNEKTSICRSNFADIKAEKNEMSFVLEKGETKEFTIDLSRMCWSRTISSAYPDKNLFEIVKSGKYTLSTGMGFDTGKIEKANFPKSYGTNFRIVNSTASNELEIEVKQ